MNEQAKARWVSLYSKAKLLCPERAGEKEKEEKKGEEVGKVESRVPPVSTVIQ